jgi:hypothetical protein
MNRHRMLPILLAVAMALMLAPGPALPITAQGLKFGVSPSLLELDATPGGTGSVAITVSNTGEIPLDAVTGVAPIPLATADHSAEAWLAVEPATLSLEPGDETDLTVTITVPQGIASGGYYAYVTVTGGGGESEAENAAAIQGQLAVPFLIAVEGEGDLVRGVTIEQFAPVIEPDGRIGFRALVVGAGNIHSSPAGTVTVTLENGDAYGSLDIPASTPLLPGSERLLSTFGTLPVQEGTAYVATVAIGSDDADAAEAEIPFTLEQPEVTLANLFVCENLDRGPTVTFEVENGGTIGAIATIEATIADATGAVAAQAPLAQQPILWPGEATSYAVDASQRLLTGEYMLTVTVTPATGDPLTAEHAFAIGGTGPNVAPICQAPEPAADEQS